MVQGIENGSASVLDSSGELHAYYHCDYLGTADYLTSPLTGKVESWTHYNEWGEITHNAVLKCGQRELDLVKEYATHDFDAVLNQYYAKARSYDADNRRFTAVDPIKDGLIWYAYCRNNPVNYIDPWGLWTAAAGIEGAAALGIRLTAGSQLAIDGEGNVGILWYGGGGFGTPNASVSGTLTLTNANGLSELSNVGSASGGSAAIGLEVAMGSGGMGGFTGFTVSMGAATPIPEAHAELTYTLVDCIEIPVLKDLIYRTVEAKISDYYKKLACEQKNIVENLTGRRW